MSDGRLKVLLVTSDREKCGIREYGRMLQEALERVAPDIRMVEHPDPVAQDLPHVIMAASADLVHVNHHAALHASWTPAIVGALRGNRIPVVVTQHDTFETWDLMAERGLPDFRSAASALVVHEPIASADSGTVTRGDDGLKHIWEPSWKRRVHYIRQGVLPAPAEGYAGEIHHGVAGTVGSVGFPFPWKNYDLLCAAALKANWGVLLIAPDATLDQVQAWQKINPATKVITGWHHRDRVVQLLAACDATAFLYQNGNSGTSAAIRLGIAARRPLLAFRCRQFRDLYDGPEILWQQTAEQVSSTLTDLKGFPDGAAAEARGIVELADRDSWDNAARAYAAIYRSIA